MENNIPRPSLESYTETTINMPPFDTFESGVYNELIISHDCVYPLYVIDHNDVKTDVKGWGNSAPEDAVVTIKRRYATNTPRVVSTKYNQPKDLPTTIIKFRYRDLQYGARYVPKLDLTFANNLFGPTAFHKRSINAPKPNLYNFHAFDEELSDAKAEAAMRFYGNDSSGKVKCCYAFVGGAVVKIGFTAYHDRADGIVVVVKQNGDVIHDHVLPLDFLDNGVPLCDRSGMIYNIARTKEDLLDRISIDNDRLIQQCIDDGKNSMPVSAHSKAIEDWKSKLDKQIANHKREMDEEKKKYDLEIKALKNKVEEAEQAKKTAETQAQHWKDLQQAQVEHEKTQRAAREAQLKEERETQALKTEKAKTVGTWLKVIIPTVLTVVGFLISKFFGGSKKSTKSFA